MIPLPPVFEPAFTDNSWPPFCMELFRLVKGKFGLLEPWETLRPLNLELRDKPCESIFGAIEPDALSAGLFRRLFRLADKRPPFLFVDELSREIGAVLASSEGIDSATGCFSAEVTDEGGTNPEPTSAYLNYH
jgi:hypothetical protein